jgi:hypothetical protein
VANGLLELIMTVLREPLVVARYGKWTQLSLGLICMASISSPQYVWTLLTRPLTEKLGVGLAELQVTFFAADYPADLFLAVSGTAG